MALTSCVQLRPWPDAPTEEGCLPPVMIWTV
jgi:hypothetical protein